MKTVKPNILKEKSNSTLGPYRCNSEVKLTAAVIRKFQDEIYSFYKKNGRDLPWRMTSDPYHILVSEIMLQQTQVQRVMEKYELFIRIFPDFYSLSNAPLQKILKTWQGMGYNRRAIALKKIAQKIVNEFDGNLPTSVETLMTFPGIGRATASAIAAFAFQCTTVFIETNIRRVFIHYFFPDTENVKDSDILPLVEKTVCTSNPREWYYALMDYGVMVKQNYENPNRKSAHYKRQSPFEGSNRQIRGMVLKLLVQEPNISARQIGQKLNTHKDKLEYIIAQLVKEGFIKKIRGKFTVR
ncbi:A/G-specific DNA glycosylase [Candidatus Scalindua japonica]|uniref:A/G-specific DNA glycosylase n=1 Tax=Candidatus Scalindua japonica TaxID=1284222 RepID=A0A286TV52_9BACT|nr:endonuclease III [Candidatus Scalindua japonica]GAX59734.1 A/G-specific DNA glycosylase [Candidatus Scalindua japonica]